MKPASFIGHWKLVLRIPCTLGYNEFDFFLENKEYRSFDGCKHGKKKIFFEKVEKGVKKCRISRWFRIRWKSCEKMHTKKVISKTSLTNMSESEKSAFFRHVFDNNFFLVHFFKTFSTDFKSAWNSAFFDTFFDFFNKKFF
jgi:hypothetical protein